MTSSAARQSPPPDARAGEITRIVIIDDHPIVRRGLAQLIEGSPGLRMVGEASSCAEALDLLARCEADVAVVDLSLDDGNGLELLGALRTHYPKVRSIVFSIHDAELYAPRALKAGASGFVSKTQPCSEVLVAIRSLSEGQIYVAPEVAQRILRRMSNGSQTISGGSIDLLSDRELEVFEFIGRGLTTGEIARSLHLSPKTVETHRQRIKNKLGIDSGTKLLIRAAQWVAQNA